MINWCQMLLREQRKRTEGCHWTWPDECFGDLVKSGFQREVEIRIWVESLGREWGLNKWRQLDEFCFKERKKPERNQEIWNGFIFLSWLLFSLLCLITLVRNLWDRRERGDSDLTSRRRGGSTAQLNNGLDFEERRPYPFSQNTGYKDRQVDRFGEGKIK